MPAKIRLKKVGRKGQPSYRVVVLDGRKPRDAKVVADLGPYDPKTNPPTFEINGEAALKWLLDGAKPTRAARSILSNAGVMAAWDAAKRGETVAIEAKELKPDEPKKKPQPAAAVEEEVTGTEPVEESPAEEEAAEVAEETAETKAVETSVEEPAAAEPEAAEEVPAEEADEVAEEVVPAKEAAEVADEPVEESEDESDKGPEAEEPETADADADEADADSSESDAESDSESEDESDDESDEEPAKE